MIQDDLRLLDASIEKEEAREALKRVVEELTAWEKIASELKRQVDEKTKEVSNLEKQLNMATNYPLQRARRARRK